MMGKQQNNSLLSVLSSFNHEDLHRVFSFLPCEDIATVAQTCRKMQDFCDDPSFLSHQIQLRRYSGSHSYDLRPPNTPNWVRLQYFERNTVLVKTLGKYNIKTRKGSRLCQAYIYKGQGDVEDIAMTMLEMSWFYMHTNYQDMWAPKFEELMEAYRYQYGDVEPDMETLWTMKDRASFAAKHHVLMEIAKKCSTKQEVSKFVSPRLARLYASVCTMVDDLSPYPQF